MRKIKLFNKLSAKGLDILKKENFSIDENEENPDIILLRSHKLHDHKFNDNLIAIGRAGAGTNNIPIDTCTEKGVVVFNTPGANANAVKELVLAGLLLASRNIFEGMRFIDKLNSNGDENISSEIESKKSLFKGTEISGKKLGIIGLGAIGVNVANDAIRLGLDVYGYDPYISIDRAWGLSSLVNQADNLGKMLSEVDFLSIHVPLTEGTKNFLNKEKMNKLKKDIIVLNFARPEVINEDDLYSCLLNKKIKKFVTDFPNNKLMELPNVIGLPHLGASTVEAEDNCSIMIAKEILDFINNGNIIHSVNFPNCTLERTSPYRITVYHQNKPNMLGKISSILAEENMNITEMMNKSKNEMAYTIIDINTEPSKILLNTIKEIDGVKFIRSFK